MSDAVVDLKFAKLLSFSADDLLTNRAGRLTPTQITHVRRTLKREARNILFITIFLVIFDALFILGKLSGNLPETPDLLWWVIVIFYSGLCLLMLILNYQGWQNMRADLREGLVANCSGPIRQEIVWSRYPSYKIHCEALTFTLDKTVYDVFTEGQAYTLYYTPRTEKVVSVERVQP